MGAPLLIPAAGAVAGALLKPNNPLQGALLGAAAGYTGGQALGITGVAPAASAVSNPLLNSQIAAQAAQPAMSYAGGNIANAAASTLPNSAAGLSFAGMSPGTANVANATPSFMDKLGTYANNSYQNPYATGQTIASVNSLLQPDQSQMPSAPTVPITKGQLKDYNPMASMDPYKQSVIGSPQISLI